MSEEEIANNFEKLLESVKEYLDYGLPYNEYIYLENTIKTILDLYNKEKAKNKDLITMYLLQKDLFNDFSLDYISKNKIRGKIEQYKKMMDKLNKAKDIDRIKAINERIIVLKEILGE